MSNKLMRLLWLLDEIESSSRRRSPLRQIAPRAKVLVTVIFLLAMLSMPVERLSELMLFALYPIMTAAIGGIGYGRVLRRSLLIAPLMALIALHNAERWRRRDMFYIIAWGVTLLLLRTLHFAERIF